ncbi:hypothetical protein RUM43_010869 [Polyplax serrata]|uniref:Uncharacterized protein n=1 Tax=Polyplax serrata TaxID=468196 RepID=A0AAN8P842_POLSC
MKSLRTASTFSKLVTASLTLLSVSVCSAYYDSSYSSSVKSPCSCLTTKEKIDKFLSPEEKSRNFLEEYLNGCQAIGKTYSLPSSVSKQLPCSTTYRKEVCHKPFPSLPTKPTPCFPSKPTTPICSSSLPTLPNEIGGSGPGTNICGSGPGTNICGSGSRFPGSGGQCRVPGSGSTLDNSIYNPPTSHRCPCGTPSCLPICPCGSPYCRPGQGGGSSTGSTCSGNNYPNTISNPVGGSSSLFSKSGSRISQLYGGSGSGRTGFRKWKPGVGATVYRCPEESNDGERADYGDRAERTILDIMRPLIVVATASKDRNQSDFYPDDRQQQSVATQQENYQSTEKNDNFPMILQFGDISSMATKLRRIKREPTASDSDGSDSLSGKESPTDQKTLPNRKIVVGKLKGLDFLTRYEKLKGQNKNSLNLWKEANKSDETALKKEEKPKKPIYSRPPISRGKTNGSKLVGRVLEAVRKVVPPVEKRPEQVETKKKSQQVQKEVEPSTSTPEATEKVTQEKHKSSRGPSNDLDNKALKSESGKGGTTLYYVVMKPGEPGMWITVPSKVKKQVNSLIKNPDFEFRTTNSKT